MTLVALHVQGHTVIAQRVSQHMSSTLIRVQRSAHLGNSTPPVYANLAFRRVRHAQLLPPIARLASQIIGSPPQIHVLMPALPEPTRIPQFLPRRVFHVLSIVSYVPLPPFAPVVRVIRYWITISARQTALRVRSWTLHGFVNHAMQIAQHAHFPRQIVRHV